MGNKDYKVLFEGKVLPGFDSDEVRTRLQHLFKADDGRMERLFSGKAYSIRKPATEREARKYEKAINKVGAECRIVSMDGSRTLAPSHKGSTHEAAFDDNITADNRSATPAQKTSLKQKRQPLQPFGRIGRCRFLALCWLVVAIDLIAWFLPEYLPQLVGGTFTIQETVSMVLGIHALALLIMVYITITRLHDMERSGWLWFFLVIPVVNLLLLLWISFSSGSKMTNMYGDVPPEPRGITRAIGAYLPVCLMVAAGVGAWLNQEMLVVYIQALPELASDWAGLEYPL
ncbi:hypothetical protein EOPP23_10730 [Endozoicomonas sp. OPT23]|uniref:DUF805 domain-containing protein n=1 Tax=Endozoicomonas sp. OPT23 TaxID=2072845 RepID=UPI00129AA4B7|nr:DUF805 domain-containing protein [Endozoicomonas sp. OPT23]MRI33460.1 hypothetical protein [Endozoicomonas sp. OPT23]